MGLLEKSMLSMWGGEPEKLAIGMPSVLWVGFKISLFCLTKELITIHEGPFVRRQASSDRPSWPSESLKDPSSLTRIGEDDC